MPFQYAFYYIILNFKCLKCCRKFRKYLDKKLFWGAIIRLMIESYGIGFICILLNVRELDLSNDDTWTYLNSVLTLIALPAFIIFPVVGVFIMCKKFTRLSEKVVEARIGEFYASYNIDHRQMLIYWAMEYVRKILLAVVVTITQKIFCLQMFVCFMSSVFFIIAAGHINHRNSKFDSRMDVFNEIKLIFIMYHMILFTNFVSEPETKEMIGYSCCVFLIAGFSVNMATLIISPFRLLIRYCRIRYAKKKAIEAMKIQKELQIAK